MKIKELLIGISNIEVDDIDIDFITSDTRKEFKGNTLFMCIKGESFDGHNHAQKMLDKGAKYIIVERDLGIKNQIIVKDSREVYARVCANWFGNPQRELKFIGVTGTNGKTTVTTLLKNTLTKLDLKIGLIGTKQNEIGDEIFETDRTTPEAYDYFELLRKMADKKCDYVVMEVSSQGLIQKRIGDTEYDIGVFTNLTQDHLNVHKTMENYYQAKKILFDKSKCAIINVDDDYGKRLLKEIKCEKKSFSIDTKADYYADVIKLSSRGSTFWFCDNERTNYIETKLTGKFNVANMVAVIACCEKLGFNACDIKDIISTINGVRGRAEVISKEKGFTVISDYAHTPDALNNILSTIKDYTEGRLICLFGCTGNRDAIKRPIMAEIAAKYSDYVIITSDDPHDENPEDIMTEIESGIKDKSVNYVKITDRREAIFHAVKTAKEKDTIVLAGKGHEVYQIFENERKVHFDEVEIVAQAIKSI